MIFTTLSHQQTKYLKKKEETRQNSITYVRDTIKGEIVPKNSVHHVQRSLVHHLFFFSLAT